MLGRPALLTIPRWTEHRYGRRWWTGIVPVSGSMCYMSFDAPGVDRGDRRLAPVQRPESGQVVNRPVTPADHWVRGLREQRPGPAVAGRRKGVVSGPTQAKRA